MNAADVCHSATVAAPTGFDPTAFVGVPIHDGAGNVVGRVTAAEAVPGADGGTTILCTIGYQPDPAAAFRAGLDRAAQLVREWHARAKYQEAMRRVRQAAAPVTRAAMKCCRNDPCPCGSGVKFKKCHRLKGRATS